MICAMTLDALRGTPRAFDPRLQRTRPHPGQLRSAANLVRLLEGSEIRQSHITCRRVQDAYSLRCAPQVHGAVRDTLAEARRVFEIELNSVTDNPLVIDDEIISGGNFHGEPLAFAPGLSGHRAIRAGGHFRAAYRPAGKSGAERRTAAVPGQSRGPGIRLHDGAGDRGRSGGENRVLAHPASTGSITTSGNKEDFVSMGMTSALKLKQVVRNTRDVLAIEMLTAARGLDCLRPLRSSEPVESARAELRSISPPWTGDRALAADIRAVSEWLGVTRFA